MGKNSSKRITAKELQEELSRDQQYQARMRAQYEKVAIAAAGRKREVRDLEIELRAAGIEIEDFHDLTDKPKNFRNGLPIIIEHLRTGKYSDQVKGDLARALAMKEANPYWETLAHIFRSVPATKEHDLFKQGLAIALGASYGDDQVKQLAELCKDVSHGTARVLLVHDLKRSRRPEASGILYDLAEDPQIGKQVRLWIRELERRKLRKANEKKAEN